MTSPHTHERRRSVRREGITERAWRARALATAVLLAACGPDTAARRACETLAEDVRTAMHHAAVSEDEVLRDHARDYLAVHGLGLEQGRQRNEAAFAVALRCRDLGLP